MVEATASARGRLKKPGGRDIVAGLSVAGLLLPEAVAYATIAGLPPGRAIYAAVAGCFVYAWIGRSRFAVVSATSSFRCDPRCDARHLSGRCGHEIRAGDARHCYSGVCISRRWALRWVSDGFIARPVLRGFAFGLAVSIILHQLPSITGVPVKADDVFDFIAGW